MDNDKNTDELVASPNSHEIAEAINEIFNPPTEKPDASEPPTLAEETHKYFERIGAQHAAGLRDKETVCVWNAWKAAKHIAKKRGREITLELFGVGYAAACKKWDKLHGPDPAEAFDPKRDNGGGIDAAIFNAARGHMLNEAATIANRLNKRKHHRKDVLPGVDTFDPEVQDGYGRSGATEPNDYDDVDLFTKRRGGDNAAIVKAADKAARQKANKPVSTVREKPLPVIDGRRRFEAREALELNVAQLLAPLPREERELIAQAWGIDGVKRLTIAELAERRGCSEAAVYRSLGRLYAEIASTAAQRRSDSKRWKMGAKAKRDGLRRA